MKTNNQNIKTQSFAIRFLKWAILVFFLCGIPMFMVMFAVYKHYLVFEHERQAQLKTDFQIVTGKIETHLNQEEFMASFFYNNFKKLREEKASTEKVIKRLDELKKLFPNEFEYIAWNSNGNEVAKTFKDEFSTSEWKNVFFLLTDLTLSRKKPPKKSVLESAQQIWEGKHLMMFW